MCLREKKDRKIGCMKIDDTSVTALSSSCNCVGGIRVKHKHLSSAIPEEDTKGAITIKNTLYTVFHSF